MVLILKSVSLHFERLYFAFLVQQLPCGQFKLTIHIIDSGSSLIQLTLLLSALLTLFPLTLIVFIQQSNSVNRALVTDFRLKVDSVVFLRNDGFVLVLLTDH